MEIGTHKLPFEVTKQVKVEGDEVVATLTLTYRTKPRTDGDYSASWYREVEVHEKNEYLDRLEIVLKRCAYDGNGRVY